MWNKLELSKKVAALQAYAACLKDETMFNIMAVTSELVENTDQAIELYNEIVFIQNEGCSLAMLEVSLNNMLTVKQYNIYHSIDEKKRFQEIDVQSRKLAGFVMANSLEDAYVRSQNGGYYNSTSTHEALSWNTENPCRSTSVGDVIQDNEGKCYMVCGMDFKQVSIEDIAINDLNS